MAYTLRNNGIIRPPLKQGRTVHRRLAMIVGGADGVGGTFSTGTANGTIKIPSCGRLVAVQYGKIATTDAYAIPVAATSGALTVKAETTAGVQIFTDADLSSVPTVPQPVGTTSLDEGGAATAATDGFSGGFPVRGGIFASIATGTDTETIVLDAWFELDTWVKLDLVAQSGADGTGAVTRTIPIGHAGCLKAIAIDYQNMPVTTDIIVKADGANGPTLFTNANSATDVAPSLLGSPGLDEAAAATAATDGTQSGLAFKKGLYVDVAQADIFTSGNERIVVELWVS